MFTAEIIVRVIEAGVYGLMYRFFSGIRVKDVQHGALQWEWAIAMYVSQWEKRGRCGKMEWCLPTANCWFSMIYLMSCNRYHK
jgi:hypothetical protein